MEHVAIMKKAWGLIPKILSGEKTIESRWYQTRRAPWNGIKSGETVYFKNSGEFVTATAVVSQVLQIEINSIEDAQKVVRKYGAAICLLNKDVHTWNPLPKYCILIFLKDPAVIKKPFQINKSGFGTPAAWITVQYVKKIKVIQ
jgi:hypothetical protein